MTLGVRIVIRLAFGAVLTSLAIILLQADDLPPVVQALATVVLGLSAGFGICHWAMFPLLHSREEKGAVRFLWDAFSDVVDHAEDDDDDEHPLRRALERHFCAMCEREVPINSEGQLMDHYSDRAERVHCAGSRLVP